MTCTTNTLLLCLLLATHVCAARHVLQLESELDVAPGKLFRQRRNSRSKLSAPARTRRFLVSISRHNTNLLTLFFIYMLQMLQCLV